MNDRGCDAWCATGARRKPLNFSSPLGPSAHRSQLPPLHLLLAFAAGFFIGLGGLRGGLHTTATSCLGTGLGVWS